MCSYPSCMMGGGCCPYIRDCEKEESEKMIGMTEAQQQNLIAASLFALGWLIGKNGFDAPPILILAKALKEAGSDCDYLDDILKTSLEIKMKRDSK